MTDTAQHPAEASTATRTFEIRNRYGIHARPAALLVKTASGFRSNITIRNGEVEVSGKSIMGLLTIEGYQGVRLDVTAQGPDAEEALEAIGELFEKKFFED